MPELRGVSIVRVELEGLRHQIALALSDHNGKISAAIQAEVDSALTAFDFEGEVRRQTVEILKDTIKKSLQSAISSAMWDQEIKEMINSQVVACLKKSLF